MRWTSEHSANDESDTTNIIHYHNHHPSTQAKLREYFLCEIDEDADGDSELKNKSKGRCACVYNWQEKKIILILI